MRSALMKQMAYRWSWLFFLLIGLVLSYFATRFYLEATEKSSAAAAAIGTPPPPMVSVKTYLEQRKDEPFHQVEVEALLGDRALVVDGKKVSGAMILPVYGDAHARRFRTPNMLLVFQDAGQLAAWRSRHGTDVVERDGERFVQLHGAEMLSDAWDEDIERTLSMNGFGGSRRSELLIIRPYLGTREEGLELLSKPQLTKFYVAAVAALLFFLAAFRRAREVLRS